MYEYHIVNKANPAQTESVYGYDYIDACRRFNRAPDEWDVLSKEYVD